LNFVGKIKVFIINFEAALGPGGTLYLRDGSKIKPRKSK
jgi:hypothetical protein